jgi:CubicO group peptidase (beta-lactamase class C family)
MPMNCLRWPALCIFFCLCVVSGVHGQLDTVMIRKVDAIFSPWDKTNGPGCALAILKDGKILYERGYGMANLEYNIAITPKSLFHVASISKQFTAAAIQKLVLEGKLSLHDDIRKFIPEMPDFGHVITVGNLMHHTSGLRDQWDMQGLAGWRDDDVVTEDDIIDMVKRERALNFIPGDDFLYCNTGFTLLGIIVKRVTGVTLRKYADSVFFRPLGMSSTVFHSDHTEIVVGRTSAYRETDDHHWAISIPVFDNYGATSLFTTVEDLAKWDENFYTHQVGGDAFIRALLEPGVLNNGERQTYASGLGVGEYRGNSFVDHTGADAGYRADFLRFPDRHFSVIVLANLANINPSRLCRQVAALFLPPGSGDVTKVHLLDSAVARRWSGQYFDEITKSQAEISFRPIGGFPHAILENYGGSLQATSDSSFVDNGGAQYVFNDAGLSIHRAGMRDRHLRKVVPVKPSAAALAEYAGTYHSDELAADFVFYLRDSVLMVQTPRNSPMELSPYKRDMFTGNFFVEFVRDRRGRIMGMKVSTGRSWDLWFGVVAGKKE